MKKSRQNWFDDEDNYKKPRRFEKDTLDKYKKSVYNLIHEDDDDDEYFTENYSYDNDFDED